MKQIKYLSLCLLSLGLMARQMCGAETGLNVVSESEKAEGWRLLFNGQNLNGWRGFKKQTPPTNGWVVAEGVLTKMAKVKGGDLLSVDQFTNFELRWEWRIPAGANNGIKYFISEKRNALVGHEFQMIDDSTQKQDKSRTASFYDVLPPTPHQPVKLAPDWNTSRLVVQGNHVEHWLNGEKVLVYECGSEEVKTGVAKSKFKAVPGFGEKITGHLLLTDHNDEASYRNIKLRELPAQ